MTQKFKTDIEPDHAAETSISRLSSTKSALSYNVGFGRYEDCRNAWIRYHAAMVELYRIGYWKDRRDDLRKHMEFLTKTENEIKEMVWKNMGVDDI